VRAWIIHEPAAGCGYAASSFRSFARALERCYHEDVLAILFFLVPLVALVGIVAWCFSLGQRRRRRALELAAWLQTGLAGRGRVLGTRWLGPSDLYAPLDLEGHRLYSASAHAHIGDRTQPDYVTFRCDLDFPPRFTAEIMAERWRLVPADAPSMEGVSDRVPRHRLGVYVITSGESVVQNYRELMRSLLSSHPLQIDRLVLSPDSPHLELTLNLSLDAPPSPAPVFRLLQRLADVVPQHSR
jgi:hypothetical protein